MIKLVAQRRLLGFRCPKCGRESGYLKRRTKRQRQRLMSLYRIWKDEYGIEQKLSVRRNIHAFKYNTFFGLNDPARKPIINPPGDMQVKPSDSFVQQMEKLTMTFLVLDKMLPLILEKYPEFLRRFEEFAGGMNILLEYVFRPIIDGRWDRSLAEWVQIVEYANVHGYNAASRKFSAIKDGKETYLSSKRIKEKIKVVAEFNRKAESTIPLLIKYLNDLMRVIRRDVSLWKEYIQILKNDVRNNIQTINQKINKFSENTAKIYAYNYYYIIHYAPKTYSKKKSRYKKGSTKPSSIDGKIECGPFKVKDFPPGVLEGLRLRNVIPSYSRIVFILSFRPFTISSIIDIMGNQTKDTITSMLEVLESTGLITKRNYLDAGLGISADLNENSSAIGTYDNLYYTLNGSNPGLKAMLEPYKRNCTWKEMLKIMKKISKCSFKETIGRNRHSY